MQSKRERYTKRESVKTENQKSRKKKHTSQPLNKRRNSVNTSTCRNLMWPYVKEGNNS